MHKSILLVAFLMVFRFSFAQNPEHLLKTSYSKCLAIKNGYYDLHMRMKFMDLKDTSWNLEKKFFFNKLKNDSVYSIAFNSELIIDGHYDRNTLYTGKELVTYSRIDSTATIMSASKWISKLVGLSHNDKVSFYNPFIRTDCYPLPQASDYTDGKHFFNFIGKETVHNFDCFHVRMIEYPEFDSSRIIHTIKEKTDYWINCKDMLPVKYTIQSTILQYGDTLSQYLSLAIKKYDINNAKNLEKLQLSAVPSYCSFTDYTEAKRIELLPNNTSVPAWTSISRDGKPVSLSDYKGKLVLIDFFYKSCYPCMQAIPVLESLHQKYKKQGLHVIGIDPVDSLNDETNHFISKAGITYTVVLNENKEIPEKYKVSGYPTFYLVGKDGKILFSTAGFDESVEGKLEELIKSNL